MMILVTTWIDLRVPGDLLDQMPKKGEAELLPQDVATAAIEQRHQNGVAGLMGPELCATLVDFVSDFDILSPLSPTDNRFRLCQIDEKDGIQGSKWPLNFTTEGVEPFITMSA